MEINRAVMVALRNAGRGRGYDIDFSSIDNPEDIPLALQILQEGRFNTDSILFDLEDDERAQVVENIISQLKENMPSDLEPIGRIAIEGSRNKPTKVMSDDYPLEGSLEEWLAANMESLYNRFNEGDYRPLAGLYFYMKENNLLDQYDEAISGFSPGEKIQEMLGEKITEETRQIREILRISEDRTQYRVIMNERRFQNISGQDREQFIRLMFSTNIQVRKGSGPVNKSLIPIENTFAMEPLINFIFTIPNTQPRVFVNKIYGLHTRRDLPEQEFEPRQPYQGKFRLGGGDILSTNKILRDYLDSIKPTDLTLEELKRRVNRGDNRTLEAIEEFAKVDRFQFNERLSRQVQRNNNLFFSTLYDLADEDYESDRFILSPENEEIMAMIQYFTRLFNSDFDFDDMQRTDSDEEQDSIVAEKINEARQIISDGFYQAFYEIVEAMARRPELKYRTRNNTSGLELLEDLALLQEV
tara:strand:- start:855 stop:2267 length:1413 start_codon:yes stop_codon:yes gene_type:complete